MSDRDNGRDPAHLAHPSTGSDRMAKGPTLETVMGDSGILERQASEWQRAEAARLEAARETGALAERQWLARELHDSISPALHSIGLLASTARTQLQPDQEKARKALDFALALTQKQLDEMRQLVAYMLADSLVEALSSAVDFTGEFGGVEVTRELCPEPALSVSAKLGLYRIAREAMHNAVKHAGGCRLSVRLGESAGRMVLDVADDGRGFDPSVTPSGHYGLVFMRERAASIGATIEITSSPGAGTRVRAAVPLAS